jgi:hypothetical protein
MGKLVPILLLCLCLPLAIYAQDPSLFQGLKGMLPDIVVKDLEALKAEDLAAAKRIFNKVNMNSNFTEIVTKESPRLFELIRDVVHAIKDKKAEAFGKFLPETDEFIGKLQDILQNAIEETAALYKLEDNKVKENLRDIFPKAMFIIEREFRDSYNAYSLLFFQIPHSRPI